MLPRREGRHPVAAARAVARDDREEGDSAAADHTSLRALVNEDACPHRQAQPAQRHVAVAIVLRRVLVVVVVDVVLLPLFLAPRIRV